MISLRSLRNKLRGTSPTCPNARLVKRWRGNLPDNPPDIHQLIISQNIRIPNTHNVLALTSGGSGARWSLFRPNMQNCPADDSFIFCDVHSESLLNDVRLDLVEKKFNIKHLKLDDFDQNSWRYNPLKYIYNTDDINALSLCIANNVLHFVQPELTTCIKILNAMICYVWTIEEERSPASANLSSVYKLIAEHATFLSCKNTDNGFASLTDFQTKINQLSSIKFKSLDEKEAQERIKFINAEWDDVTQDNSSGALFKKLSDRLSFLIRTDIQSRLCYDNISLNNFIKPQAALFISLSFCDTSYDFIASLICMQLLRMKHQAKAIDSTMHLYLAEPVRIGRLPELQFAKDENINLIMSVKDSSEAIACLDISDSNDNKIKTINAIGLFDVLTEFGTVSSGTLTDFAKETKIPTATAYFMYRKSENCFVWFPNIDSVVEDKKYIQPFSDKKCS